MSSERFIIKDEKDPNFEKLQTDTKRLFYHFNDMPGLAPRVTVSEKSTSFILRPPCRFATPEEANAFAEKLQQLCSNAVAPKHINESFAPRGETPPQKTVKEPSRPLPMHPALANEDVNTVTWNLVRSKSTEKPYQIELELVRRQNSRDYQDENFNLGFAGNVQLGRAAKNVSSNAIQIQNLLKKNGVDTSAFKGFAIQL